MTCRIADFRNKEVINVRDGLRMGYVCDIMVNVETGEITAIMVPGEYRFFGIFGREDNYIIPWNSIRRVGDDIIIVEIDGECPREKRKRRIWM